jgi:hypothetical protein
MKKVISLLSIIVLLAPACGTKKKKMAKPAKQQQAARPQQAQKKMHKEDLGTIKEIGLEEEAMPMPMPKKEIHEMSPSKEQLDIDQDGYEESAEVIEPMDDNDDYDITVMDETETTF